MNFLRMSFTVESWLYFNLLTCSVLSNDFESIAVQNMASNHFFADSACAEMPLSARRQLHQLRETGSSRYVGSGKQYWARSASLRGITELVEEGILVMDRNKKKGSLDG